MTDTQPAGTPASNDQDHRLLATKAVLTDRERELLDLKGPCSTCRLHYAHSGPCAPEPPAAPAQPAAQPPAAAGPHPDTPGGVETLHANEWLSLRIVRKPEAGVNGYVYSHESRCQGRIVAVLPYRVTASGRVEYLVKSEMTPCWGFDQVLSAITGGYEGGDIEDDAVREMLEETGYTITRDELIPLGESFASKSADTVYALFSVNLTDRVQGEAVGDGSRVEAESAAVWLTGPELAEIRDPQVAVMHLRLSPRFGPHPDTPGPGASLGEQEAAAFRRQRDHVAASHAVDRRGWTRQQWVADAERLMHDLDGSVMDLVNGHVTALLAELREVTGEAEQLGDLRAKLAAADAEVDRLRELVAPDTPDPAQASDGVLGRALLDEYNLVWLQMEPDADAWRSGTLTPQSRARIERTHDVREVLLVDPAAGRVLQQVRELARRWHTGLSTVELATAVFDIAAAVDALDRPTTGGADLLGDETCEECESTGTNCALHRDAAAAQEALDRAEPAPEPAGGHPHPIGRLIEAVTGQPVGHVEVGAEPAGDGPGWSRRDIMAIADDKRITPGDADQLRALLADRDRWAKVSGGWADETIAARSERDDAREDLAAARAELAEAREAAAVWKTRAGDWEATAHRHKAERNFAHAERDNFEVQVRAYIRLLDAIGDAVPGATDPIAAVRRLCADLATARREAAEGERARIAAAIQHAADSRTVGFTTDQASVAAAAVWREAVRIAGTRPVPGSPQPAGGEESERG